jgi:hypothetical protein
MPALHRPIASACSQITTCVPGNNYGPFQGKIPGYTAVLRVGKTCAGLGSGQWTQDFCKSLFWDDIDIACGGNGEADGLFQSTYFFCSGDDDGRGESFGLGLTAWAIC